MNSFKQNVKIMIFMTLLLKVFGFLYKILFARHFDIEVLSTISLLTPILNLSLVLSSMSIPTVVNKYVSNALSKKRYNVRGIISSSVKLTIISSSLVIILFSSLSYFISIYIYHNSNLILPIIISLPLLYFSNLSGIMKSYLEAHNDFLHPLLSNMIESVIKLLWILGLIIFFKTKSVLVITSLISLSLLFVEVCSNLYLIFRIKKITHLKITKTSLKDDKLVLKPSLYLTLFSLLLTISSFLEPIIYYSLTKHVLISNENTILIYTALHSFIFPFMQIASFLTYVLIKLLFPLIAKAKTNEKISYYLKYSFYILLILNIILFNLSFYHSEYMFNFIYHKTVGANILKLMAPFTLLTFISPILTMILESTGREKKLLYNGIISVTISIISLIILSLIQYTALYSLIYSYIIKELVYIFLNLKYILHNFHIKIKYTYVIYILLEILILIFINYIMRNYDSLFTIIITTIYTITSYLFLLFRRIRTKFD